MFKDVKVIYRQLKILSKEHHIINLKPVHKWQQIEYDQQILMPNTLIVSTFFASH